MPPQRSPRPCLLPQSCIGIPWRHRWIQEQATMMIVYLKRSTPQNLIGRSCQKLILRHPRHQRTHPQSVMPPQSRNQCRHTLHR